MFGGVAVQEGGVELEFQGLRKKFLKKFLGRGFQDVIGFRFLRFARNDNGGRQEGFPDGNLLAGRDEMVVNEFHPVDAAFVEVLHQLTGQGGGFRVGGLVGQVVEVCRGRITDFLHGFGHLAADAIDRYLRIPARLDGLQGQPHGIGIERAAKGGIGRESDDDNLLFRQCLRAGGGAFFRVASRPNTGICSGNPHPGTAGLPGQMCQHLLQLPFIRAHAFDGLLGFAEFGRRNELHRGSDLQRALDGGDAAFDFL